MVFLAAGRPAEPHCLLYASMGATTMLKAVLDVRRDELRKPEHGYVPVVFDFEKPGSRTTGETITLLSRMAQFVIADISGAKSVLQELRGIVPDNPTPPV